MKTKIFLQLRPFLLLTVLLLSPLTLAQVAGTSASNADYLQQLFLDLLGAADQGGGSGGDNSGASVFGASARAFFDDYSGSDDGPDDDPVPEVSRACDTPISGLGGSCIHLSLVGSVGGSTMSISTLRNPGNVLSSADSLLPEELADLLGQANWNSQGDLNQLLLVGATGLSVAGLDRDALYLLRATGGSDYDPDSALSRSSEPLAVQGSWHAVVSGQELLDGNVEVSALTEALYRQVEPRLDEWSDAGVRTRLDAAAQLVVGDIDLSGGVDYRDVLRWNRTLDGAQYLGQLPDLDELAQAVSFAQPEAMLVRAAQEVLGSFRLIMEFDVGTVKLETLNWESPITVANFLAYVRAGFYDQMLVHRAISNFVIQIGRIAFLEREESGNVRYESKSPLFGSIINESSNGVSNVRGTFAMARTSQPDSARAEFFVNQRSNTSLDFGSANNPDGYAVFARALTGMSVVDEIAAERTVTISDIGSDVPQRGVVLQSVTIED
jgi:cyclophilin family peptidyl-prolyl cis-trans isomerase